MNGLPLVALHQDSSLSPAKLAIFAKMTTEELTLSLAPGNPPSLKATPDGTMLDGHHRVYALRLRGVDFDALPREV